MVIQIGAALWSATRTVLLSDHKIQLSYSHKNQHEYYDQTHSSKAYIGFADSQGSHEVRHSIAVTPRISTKHYQSSFSKDPSITSTDLHLDNCPCFLELNTCTCISTASPVSSKAWNLTEHGLQKQRPSNSKQTSTRKAGSQTVTVDEQ